MIELPEAVTLARQIAATIGGRRIRKVTAAHSPHKFAWFYGDPQAYHDRLAGRTIERATAYGGMVAIGAGDAVILLGDGVGLRYHPAGAALPEKHQLLLELDDGAAVSATVQMYGGLWSFREGEFENPYYRIAQEKPFPLSEAFDAAHWQRLLEGADLRKLSAKAFLATEQRIPGLGNGVLQEILWEAAVHPKRKLAALSGAERAELFRAVRTVLARMAEAGGRDTEKDFFGKPGGYATVMSKHRVGRPCPRCGGMIKKETYLGGSVYYCEGCQAV
ncbi:formamidopyrimidine-DNA glycosylase [Hydrogenispora ethanolica]|uniref:Formamidopyrimidine-DNA glycosylase n=1 Tax=Hydrogenispora ethanolica TaxID=1082276 RepID=A0A4V2QGS8_HYDET|nr:DNA-formamidopyrimidine glycosylase family protein [Hydrogenispora ethanolica]TCL76947.1 formamidopyrimidine-DNA glycosylase [Hydrogenispora ethanolica]